MNCNLNIQLVCKLFTVLGWKTIHEKKTKKLKENRKKEMNEKKKLKISQ